MDLDHPLYITDNKEGGYDIKTEYDRIQEKLYAGVESEFGMVCKTYVYVKCLTDF